PDFDRNAVYRSAHRNALQCVEGVQASSESRGCGSCPRRCSWPAREQAFPARVNVSAASVNCRFWVSTEENRHSNALSVFSVSPMSCGPNGVDMDASLRLERTGCIRSFKLLE